MSSTEYDIAQIVRWRNAELETDAVLESGKRLVYALGEVPTEYHYSIFELIGSVPEMARDEVSDALQELSESPNLSASVAARAVLYSEFGALQYIPVLRDALRDLGNPGFSDALAALIWASSRGQIAARRVLSEVVDDPTTTADARIAITARLRREDPFPDILDST